ncbi:MAG: tetratricopeptide repeat protein [Proteobacteria bacterium]|nr:tetratricopeptide repeat protein [Pseudomonadota bacterium]
MGRKEDAEVEYREALRINPDYAEAHANLGILHSETGKKEEAKKEFEIAKELFDEQEREADANKAAKSCMSTPLKKVVVSLSIFYYLFYFNR